MSHHAHPRLMLLAACVACLTACSTDATLRMQVDEPIRVEGPMMVFEGYYVSDELFNRIKINETTQDWVLALLGEPTSQAVLNDGTEVWKWIYREQGFNTSILQLTGDKDSPTLPQMLTFVRLRDGMVIGKWRG